MAERMEHHGLKSDENARLIAVGIVRDRVIAGLQKITKADLAALITRHDLWPPAGAIVPLDRPYPGIDRARRSDFTWVTVVNDLNDVIDWWRVPHVSYPDQVKMIRAYDEETRAGRPLKPDGTMEELQYRLVGRALAVRGDATGGSGDAPDEFLQLNSGLPIGEESFFRFTTQGEDKRYVNFENILVTDYKLDPKRFSYPGNHQRSAEFEDRMVALEREYLGEGEHLSVHHPKNDPKAKDDAPDSTALALLAGAAGGIGSI